MTELLTAIQMRNLEQEAICSGDVTGLDLMERAGQGVVDSVFGKWPELIEKTARAIVFCGPGNNGGDGFVIARLLTAQGWKVEVHFFGDAGRLPPDARENYDRWCALGMVEAWNKPDILAKPAPDLLVDAVFGTGLKKPVPEDVASVLDVSAIKNRKRGQSVRRVAVDCPSGLNLDDGMIPGDADMTKENFNPLPEFLNSADLTVTFHSPKPGHYLSMGPALCGELRVTDIGLRGPANERVIIGQHPDTERARLTEARFAGCDLKPGFWPLPVIPKCGPGTHKYDFGHVMVFSGGPGRGGAARLAARGALRVGAGLVTVVAPEAAIGENAMQLNAIMLRSLDDPEMLDHVADDRVTVFCLGPGLGTGPHTPALVKEVLSRQASERSGERPVAVLDADALTCFRESPDTLFSMLHDRCILTPHEGEFARLFPDLSPPHRRHKSKIDVTREAAARAGCTVLLKGRDTVIAAPDGAVCVHAAVGERATPWLATAGAGDVLAGFIAGLCAGTLSSGVLVAAETAVWLHVEAAVHLGPGLIAEDLPEAIPAVLRGLNA